MMELVLAILGAIFASWQIYLIYKPPCTDNQDSEEMLRRKLRQQEILLNKVKRFWVEGVLKTSLQTKTVIELGLEERPDAVQPLIGEVEEFSGKSVQQLLVGEGIVNAFNQMGAGRTLLILGQPGSGKTTTLLRLAESLIASINEDLRQQKDLNQPIPVVFNLSSWTDKRQPIEDWLIKELNSKYQVSNKSLAKTWIEEQNLLLLLDGLDEVKSEYRTACVEAINQFIQKYGQTEIVVCSRIKDYEELSALLKFQDAIRIQPLTPIQINQYLNWAGNQLEALKMLLQKNADLQELADSPLMLSIMTLAYQGVATNELPAGNVSDWQNQLFNDYIERMFRRRRANRQYSEAKTKRWLIWLAQQINQESQTVFLIERMQPTLIQTNVGRLLYQVSIVVIFGLIFKLPSISIFDVRILLCSVVISTLVTVWFGGLKTDSKAIQPVETLKLSWRNVKISIASVSRLKSAIIRGTIIGGVYSEIDSYTHLSFEQHDPVWIIFWITVEFYLLAFAGGARRIKRNRTGIESISKSRYQEISYKLLHFRFRFWSDLRNIHISYCK